MLLYNVYSHTFQMALTHQINLNIYTDNLDKTTCSFFYFTTFNILTQLLLILAYYRNQAVTVIGVGSVNVRCFYDWCFGSSMSVYSGFGGLVLGCGILRPR